MATKKKVGEKTRRTWKQAEDSYLVNLHKKGLVISAIRAAINKRFGCHRKDVGIEGRLDELGLRPRLNGETPVAVRLRRSNKQMSLDLGSDGRVTVILEGKLARNGAIRQRANALISEAAAAKRS